MAGEFDPYALLQELERQRVTYIVVGGLGRVLHGSGEVTDGLDIVPSTREENLRRLGLALEELHAQRPDGKAPLLERDLVGRGVLELETDAGRLRSRAGEPTLRQRPPRGRGWSCARRATSNDSPTRAARPPRRSASAAPPSAACSRTSKRSRCPGAPS